MKNLKKLSINEFPNDKLSKTELSKISGGMKYALKRGDTVVEVSKEVYDVATGSSH